jgi:hypothetical protein
VDAPPVRGVRLEDPAAPGEDSLVEDWLVEDWLVEGWPELTSLLLAPALELGGELWAYAGAAASRAVAASVTMRGFTGSLPV